MRPYHYHSPPQRTLANPFAAEEQHTWFIRFNHANKTYD